MARREWHPTTEPYAVLPFARAKPLCPRCGSDDIEPSEAKPTILVCVTCGWDVDTPDTSRWADHEFEDLIGGG